MIEEKILIDKLMDFGLTRQEATIYLCLYKNAELTGYEVSKITGISRSNAYGALSGLTDKGAAYVVEGNSIKYLAVSIEEFCDNHMKSLKQQQELLEKNMPKSTQNTDRYITIQGSKHIENKINYMLESCEMRLYIAATGEVINRFIPRLVDAEQRGIKVVVISDCMFEELHGQVYVAEIESQQIRLITDSSYVLTGNIIGNEEDTCLYSGQEHLVTIFKEALRNKIQLILLEANK